MSIEVRVPEEINEYKERIVGGLSVRQLLYGSIGLACSVPTFFLLKNINIDIATYASMAIAVPAFCVGFIKRNGYNFETFLKIELNYFFSKSKRGYETNIDENELPIEVEEYRSNIQSLKNSEAKKKIEDEISNYSKKKRGAKFVFPKKSNSKYKRKFKPKSEYDLIKVTKKSIKRKRKTAFKELSSSTRINRKKKSKEKKAA